MPWITKMEWVPDEADYLYEEERREDDYDPEREDELEQENFANCMCGAFVLSKNDGRFYQVADCCCGRT